MKKILLLALVRLYIAAGFTQNKQVIPDLDCGYKMTLVKISLAIALVRC